MEKKRQYYIDNIRLLIISLVVLQHFAVTYSGFGSWYYIEPRQIGTVQTAVFGFVQAFNQAFFMGLLFLLAGYFTFESYNKKGFGQFIKDRVIRLGIPTIIYMLIIEPLIVFGLRGYRIGDNGYFIGGDGGLMDTYTEYITGFYFIEGSGPLWFAFALLIFSIIYAIYKKITASKAVASSKHFPSFIQILALILFISFCAFLTRILYPAETSILNMQLGYFPAYVVLFIVGIKSRRNEWFEKLDYAVGKPWLIWGISLGFALFFIIMLSGGALGGNLDPFNGGITWQSAAYSLWDSFVVVAMSIGLLALFKEKYSNQNVLVRAMSRNAFSVYVFHAPITVALSLLFAPVYLIPIVKFTIITIIGTPICFLVTNFTVQRIPFLKKLFM